MTYNRIVLTLPLLAALLLGGCQSAQTKPPPPGPAERALDESLKQSEARGDANAGTPIAAPPQAVLESLLPPLHVDLSGQSDDEPRFDITVGEMNAPEFFMGLVQETPYSMTIAPGVTGTISLSLKNVTVDEVMEVVRNTYGYEFERTRHGYQVLPIRLQTRVFNVNHLNVLRSGESGTSVSAGRQSSSSGSSGDSNTGTGTSSGVNKGTTITTRQTEGDFWTELERSIAVIIGASTGEQGAGGDSAANGGTGGEPDIAALLATDNSGGDSGSKAGASTTVCGNGRSVAVNPQTGLVVVRAMPLELRDVETFLNETQANTGRQVVLEAKILEVELSDGYKQGVNWAALAGKGSSYLVGGQYPDGDITNLRDPLDGTFYPFGQPIATLDNSSPSGGYYTLSETGGYTDSPGLADAIAGNFFSLAFRIKDFAAIIDLLKTQGNVHVLSSPRVSTVNNQKAVIKVGSDEYFVTGVTSSTDQNGNVTPEIELEPFFSGVSLDVTPQVAPSGAVTLHIHPTVVEVIDQTKTFTVYNQTQQLPLAHSTTRESDSVVRAANGQVVVIGGLLKEAAVKNRSSTPGLGDIPVLGQAFSHRDESSSKSELVILLRPVVVDGGGRWTQMLRNTSQRFRQLREGER